MRIYAERMSDGSPGTMVHGPRRPGRRTSGDYQM
jgi:hypothetical protein